MGKKRGWIHQRTILEKTLLALSSLLLITVIVLIILRVLASGSSDNGNDSARCWSKECIRTAGQVLSMLDETVEPCTDYYTYACGKTHLASPSLQDIAADAVRLDMKIILESSNSDSEEFLAAKALYESCLKFDGLRDVGTLRDLMHILGIGTWPLVDTFFDVDSRLTLEERLSALALLGVDIAFRLDVVPDPRLQGGNILRVSQGGPQQKGRTAASIRGDLGLRTRTFHAFMLLGAEHTPARTDAVDILSADAHYAQILHDDENPCDPVDILEAEDSIKELNRLIPELNWTALVNMVQKEVGALKPFGVELHCKNKIRDYIVFLDDLAPRISYNYLGWRFFSVFERHLKPDSVDTGQTDAGRWTECIRLLENYVPLLFAPSLLPSHNLTAKISDISDAEQSVLENFISRSKWLSQDQRHEIQKQVSEKTFGASYLHGFDLNSTSSIHIPQVQGGNYTLAVIRLQRARLLESFKKLNSSDEDRNTWSSNTFLPSLALEVALTRPPFLHIEGPDWMNFGGFGVGSARLLSSYLLSLRSGASHEDRASLWDTWLSNASECLLNQFSTTLGLNMEVIHHNEWLKDLFLDRSSLLIAYESAVKSAKKGNLLPGLEKQSDEKSFFLTYAQTFCEGRTSDKFRNDNPDQDIPIDKRVNTALHNFKPFREAYGCVVPDTSKDCQIWT